MHTRPSRRCSEGGVEEKKEDDRVVSPTNVPINNRPSPFASAGDTEPYDEQRDGFQAQVQHFLGSCGSALSCLVNDGGCQWPASNPEGVAGSPYRGPAAAKAPLSITDELRKLAAKEGRVFGGGMRRADIPRFLGEEAVYSFEDDNISAISQHTLEEMTKHGIRYPVRRKTSSESSQADRRSDDSQGSSAQRRKRNLGVERREGRSTSNGTAVAPEV